MLPVLENEYLPTALVVHRSSVLLLTMSTNTRYLPQPRVRERCADARSLCLPRVQQTDDQILARGRDAVRCHPARQVRRVAACLCHTRKDKFSCGCKGLI